MCKRCENHSFNRIHSLKYLKSTTLESKDIGFRKVEFVAKTQFLWKYFKLGGIGGAGWGGGLL